MIMNLLISLMVPAGSLSVVDPQAKQDAVPTFVGILRNDEPRSVRLGNLTQGTWEVLGDQWGRLEIGENPLEMQSKSVFDALWDGPDRSWGPDPKK